MKKSNAKNHVYEEKCSLFIIGFVNLFVLMVSFLCFSENLTLSYGNTIEGLTLATNYGMFTILFLILSILINTFFLIGVLNKNRNYISVAMLLNFFLTVVYSLMMTMNYFNNSYDKIILIGVYSIMIIWNLYNYYIYYHFPVIKTTKKEL